MEGASSSKNFDKEKFVTSKADELDKDERAARLESWLRDGGSTISKMTLVRNHSGFYCNIMLPSIAIFLRSIFLSLDLLPSPSLPRSSKSVQGKKEF